MRSDLRKDKRKQVTRVCWIVASGQLTPQQCQLTDASDSGGKITIPNAGTIPDKFILLLTENGAAARKCAVAWRKDSEIGVRFLGKAMWPPAAPPRVYSVGCLISQTHFSSPSRYRHYRSVLFLALGRKRDWRPSVQCTTSKLQSNT